jgi:hypothetical protein
MLAKLNVEVVNHAGHSVYQEKVHNQLLMLLNVDLMLNA